MTVMNAFSAGFRCSIRSRQERVISTGEIFLRRTSCDSSEIVAKAVVDKPSPLPVISFVDRSLH